MIKLEKFFVKTTSSVTWAAALLGVASVLSRLLGMFRDRLLSGTFGAGPELDVYYAAFRAPDFMFGLFVTGAVSAGFIPVFTRYVIQDRGATMGAEANIFASRVVSILGLGLAVISVIGAATAGFFVPAYTSGFDTNYQHLTIDMTRIMFFSPFFLGLSAVLSGILQTYKRFVVYSLAPVVYNLGIIGGTIFLARSYGIYGVAIGVVVGSFLHMTIQLISVWRMGFKFHLLFGLRDAGVREIGRMMIPRTAGLAVEQANFVVLTGIASTLGAGSIAVFNLAMNLQSFPVGILGVSFAVASFPFLAELAERGDHDGVKREFSRVVRTVMYLIVPSTVVFVLLRAQIVRLVLGTGNFNWADTVETADAVAFFAMSMFAQALLPFIVKTFFVFRNVRWPLIVGFLSVIFERFLAWKLVGFGWGTSGLVLAYSVAAALRVVFFWVLLRLMIGALDERRIVSSLTVVMIAASLMGVTMQLCKIFIGQLVNMHTFIGVSLQAGTACLGGLAVYIAVTYFLGSEEARRIVGLTTARLSSSTVREIEQP